MPESVRGYQMITRPVWRLVEASMLVLIWPLNRVLVVLFRNRVLPRSVLHMCYPVHIVHDTVLLLRRHGYTADYMALGDSQDWTKCDFRFRRFAKWMPLTLTEFWWFWRVVARYQVVHLHFMSGVAQTGWEWPVLKRMGRKIVVYHSGCEIRDRERNMALHPDMNICQDCDYDASICTDPVNLLRQALCRKYADLELLTTPDMKDFVPQGIHFPFFSPLDEAVPSRQRPYWPENGCFRIVHVTNHPGIEGTRHIQAAVDKLRAKGCAVEFIHLSRVPHHEVLAALVDADLSIGKMKMGYYANAQIEAMRCGAPTITCVREELMTNELRASALIFSTLDNLAETIEHFINHPDELAARRRDAPNDIRQLHDNEKLARKLISMYDALNLGKSQEDIAALERGNQSSNKEGR